MVVILRRAFVAASFSWAALLVLAPFLASRPHGSPLATAMVVAVYGVGGLVCHQLPERSFRLWTAQLPVCARCTGIYLGVAAATMITLVFRSPERLALRGAERLALRESERVAPGKEREPFGRAGARVLLALAAAPTAITLVYEWTSGEMPSNLLRFAAGIPIGVVVARLVVSAAENQVN